MRTIFADANYWVALANPKDQLYPKAMQASQAIAGARLLTTDEVLIEFLNHYSGKGEFLRGKAVEFVQAINQDPNITVVPQTRESFRKGLEFYEHRSDKEYSVADCISMEAMRERGVSESL